MDNEGSFRQFSSAAERTSDSEIETDSSKVRLPEVAGGDMSGGEQTVGGAGAYLLYPHVLLNTDGQSFCP